MPVDQGFNFQNLTSVLPLLVVMALVSRRMLQGRQVRLNALWTRPVIVTALAVLVMTTAPPGNLTEWIILGVIVAIGALIGWRQAKLMTISIQPDSEMLFVKASPVGVIIFMAFIAARFVFRGVLMKEASAWQISLGLITDGFIVLVVGYYCARTAEMYIRAKAMLALRAATPPDQ